MTASTGILNKRLVPMLTALSENTYLSAIRAGMVSVVPLTIIGGLFMVISYLPISGWEARVAPYLNLLQVPVTATFGLLGVFVTFAIGYDLGKRLKQEAIVSASMATLIFLLIQIQLKDQSFSMDGLGSKGLFTAILIALITVRVQKFFNDTNAVTAGVGQPGNLRRAERNSEQRTVNYFIFKNSSPLVSDFTVTLCARRQQTQ